MAKAVYDIRILRDATDVGDINDMGDLCELNAQRVHEVLVKFCLETKLITDFEVKAEEVDGKRVLLISWTADIGE